VRGVEAYFASSDANEERLEFVADGGGVGDGTGGADGIPRRDEAAGGSRILGSSCRLERRSRSDRGQERRVGRVAEKTREERVELRARLIFGQKLRPLRDRRFRHRSPGVS
jgi:hypothetical protein